MGYVIMHSPFHFSSDSDAAFRRDRLRMVWRPCAVRHTFWLCTGFTRARYVHAPTESHTGDKNYAAHSCSCRGVRVGSPPAIVDHSPVEYNGRRLRTMSHESRFFRHGFFSDSDAAFRRDRLRMVWRPCATRHTFRLCPGFTRARFQHTPTISHTGDKNYAAHRLRL